MSEKTKDLNHAIDLAIKLNGLATVLFEHLQNSVTDNQISCSQGTDLSFCYSLLQDYAGEISEIISDNTP